jgi:hypothetical protein
VDGFGEDESIIVVAANGLILLTKALPYAQLTPQIVWKAPDVTGKVVAVVEPVI